MIPHVTEEIIQGIRHEQDRYKAIYISQLMDEMGRENPELSATIIKIAMETADKVAIPGTTQWAIVQTHCVFSSLLTYKAVKNQLEVNDLEEQPNVK